MTEQRGYRGLGMEQVNTGRDIWTSSRRRNQVPAPVDPVDRRTARQSSEVYQNVQVLGDVDSAEFTRLMQAITEWVAPEQGCAYCHADGEDLSADSLYTKVVARRMLQMTQHLNAEWQPHVGATGVTCYTCHRGNNVPKNIWFKNPGPEAARGMAGNHAGQNTPGAVGRHSHRCRTIRSRRSSSRTTTSAWSPRRALPEGNRKSIKQAEWTYGLMMHISAGPGRELHLLPQQPVVLGLGPEHARPAPRPGTGSGWCVT